MRITVTRWLRGQDGADDISKTIIPRDVFGRFLQWFSTMAFLFAVAGLAVLGAFALYIIVTGIVCHDYFLAGIGVVMLGGFAVAYYVPVGRRRHSGQRQPS